MDSNYRIALVKFTTGITVSGPYEFACYDDSLKVGDDCLVELIPPSLSVGKSDVDVGIIVGFAKPKSGGVYREIVCKVDYSAYNKRLRERDGC